VYYAESRQMLGDSLLSHEVAPCKARHPRREKAPAFSGE